MDLLRLRRSMCRWLSILPNQEEAKRRLCAGIIALIDEALEVEKAGSA